MPIKSFHWWGRHEGKPIPTITDAPITETAAQRSHRLAEQSIIDLEKKRIEELTDHVHYEIKKSVSKGFFTSIIDNNHCLNEPKNSSIVKLLQDEGYKVEQITSGGQVKISW